MYIHILVYNEDEDSCYVHHDIILDSFPLCLEWLSFDPTLNGKSGNYNSNVIYIVKKNSFYQNIQNVLSEFYHFSSQLKLLYLSSNIILVLCWTVCVGIEAVKPTFQNTILIGDVMILYLKNFVFLVEFSALLMGTNQWQVKRVSYELDEHLSRCFTFL